MNALYDVLRMVYFVSKTIEISPFRIGTKRMRFDVKGAKNVKERFVMVSYVTILLSAVIAYVFGSHRTPMLQNYKKHNKLTDNFINKILLYTADCSGYFIVITTYFYQFFVTKNITSSMKLLQKVEMKMNRLDLKIDLLRNGLLWRASLLFFIDILLKILDTINLAKRQNIRAHGVYEHVVRYFFIAIMDLIILQWVCFMKLLRAYFDQLAILLKRIKYKQMWVIGDFKTVHRSHYDSILIKIGMIYDDLCCATKQINFAYSLPILLIVPISFTIITFAIFSLSKIIKSDDVINPFVTVAYFSYLFRMGGIIVPAIFTKRSVDKFVDKIQAIDADCSVENDVTGIVKALTLQVHHQRVAFSAFGLFTLNGNLIFSVSERFCAYFLYDVGFCR